MRDWSTNSLRAGLQGRTFVPLSSMCRGLVCLDVSSGSGSTYIYGHVDSAFREGFTRAECQEFVKKCEWSQALVCMSESLLRVAEAA